MIVTLPMNKESRSRKRKREVEEASPLADAELEANLKETAPKLAELVTEMEATTGSGTEKTLGLRG